MKSDTRRAIEVGSSDFDASGFNEAEMSVLTEMLWLLP